MAKGKGKSVSNGPRRAHGPKRHMFREYKPMTHYFAKAGVLSKYNDYESFCLACADRGKKKSTYDEFVAFAVMPREKQRAYFASIGKK